MKQLRTVSAPSQYRDEWHTKEERAEDLSRLYNKLHNEFTQRKATTSDADLIGNIVLLINNFERRDPYGLADLITPNGGLKLSADLGEAIDVVMKDLLVEQKHPS